MQEEFFLDYGRRLSVQSSKILFSSFHPTFGEGLHMLLLEETLQPSHLKIKNLEPTNEYLENLQNYSQSAQEMAESNQ